MCTRKHLERKGGTNSVKGQAASKCRPNRRCQLAHSSPCLYLTAHLREEVGALPNVMYSVLLPSFTHLHHQTASPHMIPSHHQHQQQLLSPIPTLI
ncbi:hypothetical protein CGRA01v4_00733 [Colletotrichum graminicola]|nr:hypothetical protein CGRA01v4_00733 [Colletotrichum graminicola]